MTLELPANEFELLVQDEERIVLYDRVVDLVYTLHRKEKRWQFPAGARTDVIFKLTGLDLEGDQQ